MAHQQAQFDIASVEVVVRDLPRSIDFYGGLLGLQLQQRHEARATLGLGGRTLLALSAASAEPQQPGVAFALRLPGRLELALALHHLLERGYPPDHAGDSALSETLYLRDPDGVGVVLYRDRPQAGWYVDGDAAAELPLDPADLLTELDGLSAARNSWRGLPAGTTIGWLRLPVPDVDAALQFYRDTLGLAVSGGEGEQIYLAAGGYHRSIVLAPASARDQRLRSFALRVAGPAPPQIGALRLRDPAGYQLQLIANTATTIRSR